ncbi:hypothetical protein ACFQZ2_06285 [Streptomonospora algeriensis]|uniref:ATP-binding protein n=1 Tax=Streptomonospora algeriensis TaxID=995084 RepID=A0ABW3BEU3_9ACTN
MDAHARLTDRLRELDKHVDPTDRKAQCPAHEDRLPSLSISPARKYRGVVVNCHAGCSQDAVLDALGWTRIDLRDEPTQQQRSDSAVVAEYDYVDEQGHLLFVKERRVPKDFRCRKPDGRGGWLWKNAVERRVLYRLPEVRTAVAEGRTVYVVEGEKDVHAVERAGGVATCNYDGAAKDGQRSKWRPEYGEPLAGADVVVIADKDGPGYAHARATAASLADRAASCAVMEAKAGKDFSDHAAAGYGLDDLLPADLPTSEPTPSNAAAEHAGGDGDQESSSVAAQLVDLAVRRYELFMSEDGRPYAVEFDGPNIALPLRGKAGLRARLADVYAYENRGRVPSQSALTDAAMVLEGKAGRTEQRSLTPRVAAHGDGVVVDLGTPDGRCVVIGPEGWERLSRSPVTFRRSQIMRPLPDPTRDGDGLAKLQDLLNLDDDGFRLLVGWLVAGLIPDIPHPILTFTGEQGTGKSNAAKAAVNLLDPSGAPKRLPPRDMKAWSTQAFNSWAICLDNVSRIPEWLSDTLCMAVTGAGIPERALYSDDDLIALEFRRVLAMTTIDAGALKGDLAERMLTLELQTIPDHARREEAEIERAYSEAHPAILASLFDLVARVLKTRPEVRLEQKPRMADFARVLATLDELNGWNSLQTYTAGAQDVVADVLEGDPFGAALLAMMRGRERSWTGTAGELLAELDHLDGRDAPETKPKARPKGWPTSPRAAGGALKRVAPALRTMGVNYTTKRQSGTGNRMHVLTPADESACIRPSQPPRPSRDSHQAAETPVTVAQSLPPHLNPRPSHPAHTCDGRTEDCDGCRSRPSQPDETADQDGRPERDGHDDCDGSSRQLSSDRPKTPCRKCRRPHWSADGSPFCTDCLAPTSRITPASYIPEKALT